MRTALLLLILLGGCGRDFDARYAETETRIKAAEAKLDTEKAEDSQQKD